MTGVRAAVALLLIAGGALLTAGTQPAEARACGSFVYEEYRIHVQARGGVGCAAARTLAREFRTGRVIGDVEPYPLRRYPRWRCGDGAGGGACINGRRVASWLVRVR